MGNKRTIPVVLLYGGIAALAMILFTIGTYRGGVQTFISNIVYLMYLIPVGFGIAAALVEKSRRQGFIDFRAALKACFGVMVLSLAIQAIFTWILVHVIDPGFDAALRPAVLAQTEAAYRRFGMPEDEIGKNIAALKDTDPFAPSGTAIGLARNYIVGFLIAVLVSAVVRHKKPATAEPAA